MDARFTLAALATAAATIAIGADTAAGQDAPRTGDVSPLAAPGGSGAVMHVIERVRSAAGQRG